jgi:hypothetical protein
MSAEIESEFQTAKEEQEEIHQLRLQDIKNRIAEEERRKAEEGYGHLIDMAATYNNARIGGVNKHLAVALHAGKILVSAEKRDAVKKVLMDGKVAIMKAWASAPFPINIPPVALATAAAVGNAAAVTGIAHGGLDSVPKEATYLLDKGERVLSPKQNKDLTQFIEKNGASAAKLNVVINNHSSESVKVRRGENGIEVMVGQIVDRIKDEVSRGVGIADTLQRTDSLRRRGA